MGKEIRNLRADEIECRIGTITEKGVTILLYKNARVDQAILDEVFGITGWQRSHCQIGGETYCTVSVWDQEKQMWVSKQDVGSESEYEKVKGAASDSFKRACFNIGIGRELYTAPFIFIPASLLQMEIKNGKRVVKDKFAVQKIEISKEKTITELSVVNQKGQEVFSYGSRNGNTSRRLAEQKKLLAKELKRTGVTEQAVIERYGLRSLDEMDSETFLRVLTALKKTRAA